MPRLELDVLANIILCEKKKSNKQTNKKTCFLDFLKPRTE